MGRIMDVVGQIFNRDEWPFPAIKAPHTGFAVAEEPLIPVMVRQVVLSKVLIWITTCLLFYR